jgi:hypothetical protein
VTEQLRPDFWWASWLSTTPENEPIYLAFMLELGNAFLPLNSLLPIVQLCGIETALIF